MPCELKGPRRMPDLSDEDKLIAFDLHYAACLHALEDLSDALNTLYAAIWLIASGDDSRADEFYKGTYQGLLTFLAQDSENLTVTDEFRNLYETQNHDES